MNNLFTLYNIVLQLQPYIYGLNSTESNTVGELSLGSLETLK
jgi:hypothetical protein